MKTKRIMFIAIEQLLEMIENNDNFKMVEVLREDSFKDGHIPSAINIPVDKIKDRAKAYLKKSDTIVVYCASYTCHASTNAAKILLSRGYNKVFDFKGSKKTWVDSGFELEK